MASPVGHLAFGVAAAAVAARAVGAPDSATLWIGVAVASGIPDVDVVFQVLGLNKRYHRNGTHSVFFAALVMAVGVGALRQLDLELQPGVVLVWVAALLSHLALDVLTTGPTLGRLGWGIPLFWPLSRKRFHVRRPLLVGDRTESHGFSDTLREMREDSVRLVPPCLVVILLVRLWPG